MRYDSSGDNKKHNFEWINYNRKNGKYFADKHCQYRKLMKNGSYDFEKDTILRINDRFTKMEFIIVFAKESKRTNTATPIDYEYSPKEFVEKINKAYETLRNKIINWD